MDLRGGLGTTTSGQKGLRVRWRGVQIALFQVFSIEEGFLHGYSTRISLDNFIGLSPNILILISRMQTNLLKFPDCQTYN